MLSNKLLYNIKIICQEDLFKKNIGVTRKKINCKLYHSLPTYENEQFFKLLLPPEDFTPPGIEEEDFVS